MESTDQSGTLVAIRQDVGINASLYNDIVAIHVEVRLAFHRNTRELMCAGASLQMRSESCVVALNFVLRPLGAPGTLVAGPNSYDSTRYQSSDSTCY